MIAIKIGNSSKFKGMFYIKWLKDPSSKRPVYQYFMTKKRLCIALQYEACECAFRSGLRLFKPKQYIHSLDRINKHQTSCTPSPYKPPAESTKSNILNIKRSNSISSIKHKTVR